MKSRSTSTVHTIEHAMNEISFDIHGAYDKTRKTARQNIDRSLHHAALEYLMLNNDAPRYEDLVEQLGRIERGEKLDCGSQSLVKTGIKSLYEDFLEDSNTWLHWKEIS
ncbi:hypothetical protein HDV62DRAFT_368295 [Trichoderma sp. SZMC 28011]